MRFGFSAIAVIGSGLALLAAPSSHADPGALDAAVVVSDAPLTPPEELLQDVIDILHLQNYEFPGMLQQMTEASAIDDQMLVTDVLLFFQPVIYLGCELFSACDTPA